MVGSKGVIPTLFDTIEKNPEDGKIVRASAEALNRIGMLQKKSMFRFLFM